MSRKRNLLTETLEILERSGKSENDVKWVGSSFGWYTWDEYKEAAREIDYIPRAKCTRVAYDLMIVGNGWWLERESGNRIEHWVFRTSPRRPRRKLPMAPFMNADEDEEYDVDKVTLMDLNTNY